MQTTLGNSNENAGFLPRRVLVIGGSARAAAQSAIQAGMEAAAIDLFGDQDLRAITDHWLRWSPTEPLVDPIRSLLAAGSPISTAIVLVGGAESAAESLDDARRQLESPTVRFLIPTVRQVHMAADPAGLQSIADRSGIDFPDWRPSHHSPDDDSQRWLIKPVVRCGGLSVRDHLGGPLAQTDTEKEQYVQRFVPGRLVGASYCADSDGARCLGVCLGRTAPANDAPFRYAGSIGPVPVSAATHDTLQRLGTVIHDTLGLRGLFGVDLICTATRVYLLEINMRYCASMELLDSEVVNCLAMHCHSFSNSFPFAAAKSDTGSREWAMPQVRCKRIVYAKRRIVWDHNRQYLLNTFLQQRVFCQGAKQHVDCRDLPCLGTVIDAGAPLLTMLTSSDSAANAWRQATRQTTTLRRLLES